MDCQRSTTRSLSWPSAKQCASISTVSPAMRLIGKRPPSTAGSTASMTARTRPSIGLASVIGSATQKDGRQRRQIEIDRFDATLGDDRYGFHAAQIAPAGAAVFAGVGIQNFAPYAAARYAHQVIAARHRRKVADDEQRRAVARSLAQEGDDADVRIAEVEPFETVG